MRFQDQSLGADVPYDRRGDLQHRLHRPPFDLPTTLNRFAKRALRHGDWRGVRRFSEGRVYGSRRANLINLRGDLRAGRVGQRRFERRQAL
jgi:hypothetical protein